MSKTKKMRRLMKRAKRMKPDAMFRLGVCCELGLGICKDPEAAKEWISAAAEQGYQPARAWIDDLYFDDDARLQAEA